MTIRPLVRKARAVFHRMKTDTDKATSSSVEVDTSTVEENKRDYPAEEAPPEEALPKNGAELPGVPAEELQHGVKDVEAVTQTWSRATLIAVFIKCVYSAPSR